MGRTGHPEAFEKVRELRRGRLQNELAQTGLDRDLPQGGYAYEQGNIRTHDDGRDLSTE